MRHGGGGSSWKLRIAIAAAIALFALIRYYASGERNPTTGEVQRVGMSEQEEIALGLQAAPQMIQQHAGLHPSPQDQQQVDQVGIRLLNALQLYLREQDKSLPPYPFDFHLLADDRTVNAFALPGGQVFITMALYRQLQTEGQLAGVLGHEVGHVIERHGAQRLAKQNLTQGLVGAAGAAGGDIDSVRLAQVVGSMVNMKYGRDDELESDKWSVRLSVMAGYDPRAMLGVMEILDRAGGGGSPEFLSTHPKPANRAQYIEDVIQASFPEGLPEGLVP